MFDKSLTMRLDNHTEEILRELTSDLNFSKAEVIRKSLRTFKLLCEFQKKHGTLRLVTPKGKELFILLT